MKINNIIIKYILLVCWFGWFVIFIIRFSISPILALIENDFNISHSEAGLLMTSYLLGYALMQIPAGMLTDKFGQKHIIIFGILGTSLANVFVGLSNSFLSMVFWRFITGLMAGTYFSASTSLVLDISPNNRKGKAFGLVVSGIGVGTITVFLLGGLLGLYNWRLIFYISSILGLINVIFFWKLVKKQKVSNTIKDYSNIISYKIILKNISLVNIMIIHFLVLITYFSLTTFIPTYFILEIKLNIFFANIIFIVFPLSEILGAIFGGIMADKIGKKTVTALGLFIIILITGILSLVKIFEVIFLCLLMIGFMSRVVLTILPIFVGEYASFSLVGTALGWYNAIGFLGSAVGPYIFGLIADIYGFNLAFLVVGVMTSISIPLIIMVRK